MNRKEAHIPFLDHLRGVAVLFVFLSHIMGSAFRVWELPWDGMWRSFHVNPLFLALLPGSWGFAGVAIFFVVSGFCIHLSHQRSSRDSWTEFSIRRFFRIYPPYLIAVMMIAFLPPWHNVSLQDPESVGNLASHLLMLHNYHTSWFFNMNGAFWSIAIECQLYLIYPLLLLLTERFGWRKAMVIVGAIELLARAAVSGYMVIHRHDIAHVTDGIGSVLFEKNLALGILSHSPFFYWFSWSLGAAIAEAWMKGNVPQLGVDKLAIIGGLSLGAYLFRPASSFVFTGASLITTWLLCYLLNHREERAAWIPQFLKNHLKLAGVLSYSIYLYHLTLNGLILTFIRTHIPAHVLKHFVVLGILGAGWFPGLLFCWLYYRGVELPSIEIGKRIIHRKRLAARPLVPELS